MFNIRDSNGNQFAARCQGYGEAHCAGGAVMEAKWTINTNPCPTCVCTNYTDVGECSAACGQTGVQRQIRDCTDDEGSQECDTLTSEIPCQGPVSYPPSPSPSLTLTLSLYLSQRPHSPPLPPPLSLSLSLSLFPSPSLTPLSFSISIPSSASLSP